MKQIFLQEDDLTRDILALLAVSDLSKGEKKRWLDVLPDMSNENKEELKQNLEEQVALDTEIAQDAVADLVKVLSAH